MAQHFPDSALEISYGGACSLVNELGKLCMAILKDGRHLVGKLTSYDQFSNMVLEETKERHFAAGKYTDLEIGTFVIRGDNLVLLAELDEALEAAHPALEEASLTDVLAAEAESARAAASKVSWTMHDDE